MMHFEWPWIFYLLPLPWFIYRFLPIVKQIQSALYMPLIGERHVDLTTSNSNNSSWWIKIIMLLIWISILTAAAKPIKIGEEIEMPNTGRDVLLAVDISGSMQTPDMTLDGKSVDRLVIVKNVVKEFISKREGDRLGLILFGTNAYIQAPLTFDIKTVSKLLNESQIGFAGEQTAIGDAIGLSIKRLAENPADSRVVILLTDGQNTTGEVNPLQAGQLAKQEHVVIYTIGMGSDKPISRGFFGGTYNPSADLDEKTLNTIAETTGGKYFRARNQEELNAIYETIDKLEAIEHEAEVFRPQQSLFHWPLALAIFLSFILALSKQFGSKRFNIMGSAR